MKKLPAKFIGEYVSYGTADETDIIQNLLDFFVDVSDLLDRETQVEFDTLYDEYKNTLSIDNLLQFFGTIAPEGSFFSSSKGKFTNYGFFVLSPDDFSEKDKASLPYGVFVYDEDFAGEPPDCRYFSTEKAALNCAKYLETLLSDNEFVEVWEKDYEGFFGDSGMPVFASARSGYSKAIKRNNAFIAELIQKLDEQVKS